MYSFGLSTCGLRWTSRTIRPGGFSQLFQVNVLASFEPFSMATSFDKFLRGKPRPVCWEAGFVRLQNTASQTHQTSGCGRHTFSFQAQWISWRVLLSWLPVQPSATQLQMPTKLNMLQEWEVSRMLFNRGSVGLGEELEHSWNFSEKYITKNKDRTHMQSYLSSINGCSKYF